MALKSPLWVVGLLTLFVSTEQSFAQNEPPPQVAISPPRLEFQLDEGGSTESVHLLNLSDKGVHVTTSISNWDMDENNNVRVIAPTEQSLDQWIILNPLTFAIPPNSQQTVRLAVRPRVAPEPGEHRAIIFFEQQPGDDEEAESGMNIRYRIGVAAYGLSGQIDRRGRVLEIRHRDSGDDLYLEIDIVCEGNASVRLSGRFGIWPESAFPGVQTATKLLDAGNDTDISNEVQGGLLPELPVLPGYTRTISTRVPRPQTPGHYILFVFGKLAGAPFREPIRITIP